jgi:hypothetical protein
MSELPELLERFRRGPELVAMSITGAAGAELDFVPAPGKWSVRQILCHLADGEIVAGARFRSILAEDNPLIIGYDQDAWAANLDYTHRKIAHALETFRHMRASTYDLLHAAPEPAFERKANHSERGPLILMDLLRTYVRHAEKHCEQISRVRQEYKASTGKSESKA